MIISKKIFVAVSLLTSLGLVFFLLIDYLTLHDIYKDYVGQDIINRFQLNEFILPSWTQATLEWTWLRISFLGKLLIVFINIYFLIRLVHQSGNKSHLALK